MEPPPPPPPPPKLVAIDYDRELIRLARLIADTREGLGAAPMDRTYATLKPRFHIIQLTGRIARPRCRSSPARRQAVSELRLAVEGMGRGGRDQAGYSTCTPTARPPRPPPGALQGLAGRRLRPPEHEVYEKDGQKRSAYRVIGYVEFLAAPRNGAVYGAQEGEDWRSDLPDEAAF